MISFQLRVSATACRALDIIESSIAVVLQRCCRERLEGKFSWLREYRQPLARSSQWLALVTAAEQQARRQGLALSTVGALAIDNLGNDWQCWQENFPRSWSTDASRYAMASD